MTASVAVAILGAGPYGLSLAAHLHAAGVPFVIFGQPMENWATRMPERMYLKSDGFASGLYDPHSAYTLKTHCEQHGIDYADTGLPVSRALFVEYGRAFQRALAPSLHAANVTAVAQSGDGYLVTAEDGYRLHARAVVVATGLSHVEHVPDALRALPPPLCAHSSAMADLSVLKDRRVIVVGAGASASDVAGLAAQEGAAVTLVSRQAPTFHERGSGKRSLWQRLTAPNLGLGPNLRSSLCIALPDVFHALPAARRAGVVRRHLGPAGGWFMRDLVLGHVTQVRGEIASARAVDGAVELAVETPDGGRQTLSADRVVAATGYQVDVARYAFLSPELRAAVRTESGSPRLSHHFQSSVPGLYFVGLPAAIAFGPAQRFAIGARFAAGRVSAHLRRYRARHPVPSAIPVTQR